MKDIENTEVKNKLNDDEMYADVVEKLLSKNADMNLANTHGESALMLACQKGNAKIVKQLLQKGEESNIQLRGGSDALLEACMRGHTDIVDKFFEYSVDLEWYVLYAACRDGYTELVEKLLDRGADLTTQTTSGITALMMACQNGHKEIVKILLQKGGSLSEEDKLGWKRMLNAQNKDGHTALMISIKLRHTEIIEALVNAEGAEFDAVSKTELDTALTMMDEDIAIRDYLKGLEINSMKGKEHHIINELKADLSSKKWEETLKPYKESRVIAFDAVSNRLFNERILAIIEYLSRVPGLKDAILKAGGYDVRRIKHPETRYVCNWMFKIPDLGNLLGHQYSPCYSVVSFFFFCTF